MKKLILLAAASVLALSACSAPVPTAPARSASASAASPAPAASTAAGASCAYTATGDAVKQVDPPPATGVANQGAADYVLTLNGEKVNLTLDQASAPCTVNSFTSLAAQGFFDGSSCHRLVDDSGLHVLQCGDPSGTGSGGPGYQFADELTGAETYPAGTLAMANAGPGTNGSQFFMVFADSQLSPDYTVFGHVDAAGIKVLESIAKGGDDNSFGSAGGGKPNLPAVITSVQPA
ncbi:MAG: peptidylprolyl isomerase [Propionicimonas sp.]